MIGVDLAYLCFITNKKNTSRGTNSNDQIMESVVQCKDLFSTVHSVGFLFTFFLAQDVFWIAKKDQRKLKA
jgi:hypothetical protein